MKKYILIFAFALATACSPESDLQGHDPRAFYKEHPIKNEVEEASQDIWLNYEAGKTVPTMESVDEARDKLADISPDAVVSLTLALPEEGVAVKQKRSLWVKKWLKGEGYSQPLVMLTHAQLYNTSLIQLRYAKTRSPRCPDWRASPHSNYSNANYGNYSCASVTNLGKMVADPRDLKRGRGSHVQSSERLYQNNLALQGGGTAPAAPAAPAPSEPAPSATGSTGQ